MEVLPAPVVLIEVFPVTVVTPVKVVGPFTAKLVFKVVAPVFTNVPVNVVLPSTVKSLLVPLIFTSPIAFNAIPEA